jgi:tRNA dimethylallyltransferase
VEPTQPKPELLVIVGPTASGKSELAFKIAKKFNGEIIAGDSRTVYKDMNIGTAKPSLGEQKLVPHWGLDLIEPGKVFSAAQFKKYAEAKIKEIRSRGKLPILVGGTGLYIASVLFDFSFVKTNPLKRFIYSSWSIEKLQKVIQQRDWPLPENQYNKRHLVRTLERAGRLGTKQINISDGTLIIGLMPPDKILKKRINDRAEKFFAEDIVGETKSLLKKYGTRKLQRTGGIIYKFSADIAKGKISKEEAKELFKSADWQYARRQKTWFKRNKFIHWYESAEEAISSVNGLLNK